MSLGSRIISRGKGTVVASLSSTPRDLLLFPYPQWIRHFSASPLKSYTQWERAYLTTSLRYVSPDGQRRLISTYENPAILDNSSQTTEDVQNLSTLLCHEETSPSIRTPSEALNNNLEEFHQPRKTPFGKYAQLPIERKVRRILSQSQRAQQTADYDRQVRLAYQAYKVEKRRSWLPDWRVILADLVKHTPKNDRWLEKALTVEIPADATRQLLYGIDDNMWDIGLRYGCSVELDSLDEDTHEFRQLTISGSASAISKTAADVLGLSPTAVLKVTPRGFTARGAADTTSVMATGLKPGQQVRNGSVRNVMSEKRPMFTAVSADKILVPKEWTIASLAAYVKVLTSLELPTHLHRLIYPKGQEHVMTTVETLQNVFTDPNCKSSITRTAFNTALAFFIKKNKIIHARVLFVQMEVLKLEMDTETFNIMLRGAAKAEDLHNFHFILHLMLRRGFLPNARTWTAFMMAVPELPIKLYIMSAMKQKGLLSHLSTIRAVAEQVTTHEIQESLARNDSQKKFIEHMDSRYGPKWLSTASGNRILHALGARGLISRCWQFLQIMEDRFAKPNSISINTVLNHCKHADNLHGAVELMKTFVPSIRYVPDELTYHILFELAWRSKSYNLARVIWKYACLAGATSYRMRSLVFSNLKNAAWETQSGSRRESWKHYAGQFITDGDVQTHLMARFIKGVNSLEIRACGSPEYQNSTPGQSKVFDYPHRNPIDVTAGLPSLSNVKFQKPNIKTIKELLHYDYTVFQAYKPSVPLGDMLAEAFERDMEWKGLSAESEMMSIDWMLQRGVKVEVEYKDPTKCRVGQRILWE